MTVSRWRADQPVRFGTRGSALALAQTALAIARFHVVHPGIPTEVRVVRTEGDRNRLSPLTEIGGRGVFTSAIEDEIIAGRVDAAVHSAKDLPTELRAEAPVVAFPDRDDPRDVLVSRHGVTLDALPLNPVIGTSSRRREAQIRRLRPDARFVNIRGNVDTRLRKAQGAEFDGVVLAAAGILRMGLADQINEYFPVELVVPSPGQGAIAVQARAGDDAAALLTAIDEVTISGPVRLERAFLNAAGAGCTMPIGAYVQDVGGRFRLLAMVSDPSGMQIVDADELLDPGDEARQVAEIANRMLSDLGIRGERQAWAGAECGGELAGARVVVTRPRMQAGQLMSALVDRGAEPIMVPTIRIEDVADCSAFDSAFSEAARGEFDWIVFTSANAVRAVERRLAVLDIDVSRLADVKMAAVGEATAAAVVDAGLHVSLVPETADADHLAAGLGNRIAPGARILYPRSAIGRDAIVASLRELGADMVVVDAYRTLPESDCDPLALERIRRGDVDAIAFSSPSSVTGLLTLLGDERGLVTSIPVFCAGPVTAEAAEEAGLTVAATSADPSAKAMTDAVASHWRARNTSVQHGDGQVLPIEYATNGRVK